MAKHKGSFTDEERAAMQERALEALGKKNNGEAALLAKIAEMKGTDKVLATKIHELVRKNAPTLVPKTWYGMPAYGNKNGKIICFFQSAAKFKVRYATLGFQPDAKLDDGAMWPVAFALTEFTPQVKERIVELIKKAAG